MRLEVGGRDEAPGHEADVPRRDEEVRKTEQLVPGRAGEARRVGVARNDPDAEGRVRAHAGGSVLTGPADRPGHGKELQYERVRLR